LSRRSDTDRHRHALCTLFIDKLDREAPVRQVETSRLEMTRQPDREALGKPVIDPRHGDVETDFSSTKQHSVLSLAGGLLLGLSLPKLIMAWTLLLLVPGLLLGLGPIVASDWVRAL